VPLGGDPFKGIPSGTDKDPFDPSMREIMAVNLANRFLTGTEQHHRQGVEFWDDWKSDATRGGELAAENWDNRGANAQHGSAILSTLSPQTHSQVNRFMALQLGLRGPEVQQAEPLVRRHLEMVDDFSRTDKSGMSDRAIQGRKAEIAAARLAVSDVLRGTPLGAVTSSRIGQVMDIAGGKHNEDPFAPLGALKTGDFSRAGADPARARRITIDTHINDALHGRTDIPYDSKRRLDNPGVYENAQSSAQDSYDLTLEQTGMKPDDLSRSDYMAGAWVAHRDEKQELSWKSSRSEKAAQTKMAKPGFRPFAPELHGLKAVTLGMD
jgi:hypothetical protein